MAAGAGSRRDGRQGLRENSSLLSLDLRRGVLLHKKWLDMRIRHPHTGLVTTRLKASDRLAKHKRDIKPNRCHSPYFRRQRTQDVGFTIENFRRDARRTPRRKLARNHTDILTGVRLHQDPAS